MSVADALSKVLAGAEPLPTEHAPLADAYGRVLTADVTALRMQPPTDVSAMDGYAVRAADVSSVPARLGVIGEVAAGHPFDRSVAAGQAVRIFTGGVVPSGADTIVIQENATRDGDTGHRQHRLRRGRHIRVAGLDFAQGAVLLAQGHRLTERDLALAAAMNHPALPVHRRPKVAVLATGDELVMPGIAPGIGQIVYSNGFATMALVRREGCDVIDLGIAPDRLDRTPTPYGRPARAAPISWSPPAAPRSATTTWCNGRSPRRGLLLSFWKIAMRPGRPMMHGRLGAMHVLGLPGNPVSSYVCSVLFLVPLIRRLVGRSDVESRIESAVLGCDLGENDERADYLRATLSEGPNGHPVATPFATQDSSMLSPLAKADCLVIREAFAPATKAGSACRILRLDA
jgi:molybdopterin molybdotransferase